MSWQTNHFTGMALNNEPTWKTYRKVICMMIQSFDNVTDVNSLLEQSDDHDLHINSGKCFVLLMAALRSSDKSPLETALTEFKKLEGRCGVETGGWMTVFKRRLFPTIDVTVTDYDRQIVLADACMSIAFLSIAMHEQQSVGVTAKAAYLVRRAWKTYHQCYVAVLEVYRGVFDLGPDQNTLKWPSVLKRRQSVNLTATTNTGSRMSRSATTSFKLMHQNRVTNVVPEDLIRLMTAVSMGYGAFNLFISLLPSKFASAATMFGFRGNRQTGLDALTFAKNGPDVHAPFAWLILLWYRMIGNTDFMFDGPRSRENLSIVNECEQLVRNPPEEFQNSTILQYFTGRLFYLKGDLKGSIRAYEIGSTIIEKGISDLQFMCLHELGFMYAHKTDWTSAYRIFANVAGDNVWMRPYHYFMAAVCAGAARDAITAKLMSRLVDATVDQWSEAERKLVGGFVSHNALRTPDFCPLRCRLIAYEVMYVKYGMCQWPAYTMHTAITECREIEDDDDTTRITKRLLTIFWQKALGLDCGPCLAEIVDYMEQTKRRDHLYAYGLYELAVEQVGSVETASKGKQTLQKLKDLKNPYNFQYYFEKRCESLQAYVQKMNAR